MQASWWHAMRKDEGYSVQQWKDIHGFRCAISFLDDLPFTVTLVYWKRKVSLSPVPVQENENHH
jgi:hypothetical protein